MGKAIRGRLISERAVLAGFVLLICTALVALFTISHDPPRYAEYPEATPEDSTVSRVAPDVESEDTPQSPTEVAFERSPSIYWASDAISRSLELFPAEHNPYDAIAGLLYRGDYDSAWMQEDGPDPNVDPEEGVWLVGIRGIGLTEDDIFVPFPFLTPSAAYVPRRVDGAFYAWDPNTGYLIADGVLAKPASADFYLNYELLVTVLNDFQLTE